MAVKKSSSSKSSSSGSDNGVICAVLSYFLIGIIWFFVDEKMKRNNFVKFHVKQSLVLLVLSVCLMIVSMVLAIIPILGWAISLILNICLLVLWVLGLVYALQGKSQAVPVVGHFADKFNF